MTKFSTTFAVGTVIKGALVEYYYLNAILLTWTIKTNFSTSAGTAGTVAFMHRVLTLLNPFHILLFS